MRGGGELQGDRMSRGTDVKLISETCDGVVEMAR